MARDTQAFKNATFSHPNCTFVPVSPAKTIGQSTKVGFFSNLHCTPDCDPRKSKIASKGARAEYLSTHLLLWILELTTGALFSFSTPEKKPLRRGHEFL